jgi:hypothetical protein
MPPRYAEYRYQYAVGVWWSGSQLNVPNQDGTAGTTLITSSDANGVNNMLRNPVSGYVPNHLTYPFFAFSVPAVQEDTQFVSQKLDDNKVGGPLYHSVTPTGRTGATGTGIEAEYYQADPQFWTDAFADQLVQPIVTNYQDHPSLLAYNLDDDVSFFGNPNADAVIKIAESFQRNDPYGRPATFIGLFPNDHNYWADYDCKLVSTYIYPCGYYADGVTPTAEGDFMSARVHVNAPMVSGATQRDWVDYLRWWFSYVPSGAYIWLFLQTHSTTTGTNGLREPTPREYRKQFWIAVGEGVKGIYWFRGDLALDSPTPGLFDVTRRAYLDVASELSDRLNLKTRQRLLKCRRVTDLFTTSGGGASYVTPTAHSYPSAYKSTLLHEDGTYYVVICNHSTSTATVTINSATKSGRLQNMETGEYIRVGGTWSCRPLDGTIFEFVPDLGVPDVKPTFGYGTVEAWWDTHYANPTSANYIPPGAIQTYPREVTVAPGNLEAALNSEPQYTTFRLQAGNHPWMNEIVGKRRFALIADDPLNRPVLRGIDIFGTSYALQYNNEGGTGFPAHLITLRTPAALEAWRNPADGIIIRDIDFRSDGELVKYAYYQFPNGNWNHDHRWENVAIFMRNVRGVLIESCTAAGYVLGTPDTDPTVTQTQTTYNAVGAVPNTHEGIFCGNAGIENVVIRDCDFEGTLNVAVRIHNATFFDGARGVVQHDIRTTGKFSGLSLVLTNGDFSFDENFDGSITRDELRDGWSNVWSEWNVNAATYGQNNGFALMGGNNLIKGGNINLGGGSMTWPVQIACKAPLAALTAQGIFYTAWTNVIDDLDITGSVTTFLEHDVDQGIVGGNPNHPYRSRVGYSTVKNCNVSGTVGTWIATKAGATATVDGPSIELNNTP